MDTAAAPILDADHAAFITGAVVITAASRDAQNVPSVCPALGCRLTPDRRRLTLFLCAARAGTLPADVAAHGAIAAVFGEPSTNRTIQVKGTDAAIVPVDADVAALLAAHAEAMIPQFAAVHFPPSHARAVLGCPDGGIVAVAFTPSAAFVQTPGLRAGEPLPAGAPLPPARS